MYEPIDGYESKLSTPSDALSHIKPGDRIFTGTGCAEPSLLLLHLSNMQSVTEDNVLLHFFSFGAAPYIKKQYETNFRYNSFFITANIREAIHKGKADYTPMTTRYIPRLFLKKTLPIDVALIQCTPPDQSGYVSLGISVDITKSAVENSRLVIAEVNPNMPTTHGDSLIHISNIDYFVENRSPLIEWIYPPPTNQMERVARNISTLIEDGSTLQFGIGKIPNILPKYLIESQKKDLGIHSEAISESVLDLIESGIVTNEKKPIHTGETVTTFCMGTERLYNAINDNPKFKFFTSGYVLDPNIIAQHSKMCTINSALEIDLTGQVVADSLGPYLYSGIGGAVDFHRGALRSIGGKAIIALPSTSNDGKKSRIVCNLASGGGVAITRAEIEYVVTEYGIAYLHGVSLRERVLKMIEIAHPQFREEIFQHAKLLGYIYPDQVFHDVGEFMLYPLEFQESFILKNGLNVRIRPILPSDEEKLRDFFYTLSERSRYSRYFSAIRSLPHKKAQREVNIDFSRDWGVAAFLGPISGEKIIGVGHFYLLHDNTSAEVSLLVGDTYRNNGLARAFLYILTKVACDRGIMHFITEVIEGNQAALKLLKDFSENGPAKNPQVQKEAGATILTWDVPSWYEWK